MLFCVTAFFCQITTNLMYAYLTFKEAYHPGHSVDLLRIFVFFFIGLTAVYAKNSKSKVKLEIPNPLGNKEIVIPYTSILLLLFLVIDAYEWNFNALSIGLLLAFLMIIARQLRILNKNKNLVSQFKHQQKQILKENGCIIGQGYLFSKPVAANEFEALFRETINSL